MQQKLYHNKNYIIIYTRFQVRGYYNKGFFIYFFVNKIFRISRKEVIYMKDTDARIVTHRNQATARGGEKIYRTDKGKKMIALALILTFTVLFLLSCAPVGECDWLAELKGEGRYAVTVTDSDGTEYKGEFYIGATGKENAADTVRSYTFVYTAPEILAGIKTVYADGKTSVTLDGYTAEITLPATLGACIPGLVAGFFEAGNIKEVRAGGTYTEMVTDKAVYCIDKDGSIAEILPTGVSEPSENDSRSGTAKLSENLIIKIRLSPLQGQG